MSLKNEIENLLKEKNIEYKFIPLPEELSPDVPTHAAFHGIKLANAMVTILYSTEKGIIGVIKRADTQIDETKVKGFLKVETLKFASKEDLTQLGTEVGIVPYLGLSISYLIDKKILSVGRIYGTAGDKTMGMAMDAADLVRVNNGKKEAIIGKLGLTEKN